MNERIHELLVKARESTKEGKWNAPTSVWAEKFAELIIEETIHAIIKGGRGHLNPASISKSAKEHFGME